MDIDTEKIDEAVLALLYLNAFDVSEHGGRAWKSFDWEAMNRLHEKGLISDPKTKNKSIIMGPKDIAKAKKTFEKLFGKSK